jgi:hypothetical protein
VTRKDAFAAMGTACVRAAIALALSWLPSYFYLAGAGWATAGVAGFAHRLTLAAVALYPFAVGARIKSKGAVAKGLPAAWALRCALPLLAYAALTHLAVRATPHIGKGAVLCYAAACLPLALYGLTLKAEAVSASAATAKSS